LSLSIFPTRLAVVPGAVRSFVGRSGTPPYTYAVVGSGTILPDGTYTAPAAPTRDIVQVTDALLATASAQVTVGSPLQLFCDILATEMSLSADRVYLWDQKLFQPKDSGLYIAVGVVSCKPFSNITREVNGTEEQSTNFLAVLDINIMSKGSDARDRKEEIVMALKSNYARQQQEAGAFSIATIPTGFVNLSQEDGAAIPYRFTISVQVQYSVTKTKAIPFYDSFDPIDLYVDA
jgi:hypothetical protein